MEKHIKQKFILAVMQFELFKHGILLRGGCTKGMIYSDASSNILFGPALTEAYKIESEFSVYPRIVVSESVWADYMRDMTTSVHWLKSDFTANRGYDFMEVAETKYVTAGWKRDVNCLKTCLKIKKSVQLNEHYFFKKHSINKIITQTNYFIGILKKKTASNRTVISLSAKLTGCRLLTYGIRFTGG